MGPALRPAPLNHSPACLISAANMALKMGDGTTAAAEYTSALKLPLSAPARELAERKLAEANAARAAARQRAAGRAALLLGFVALLVAVAAVLAGPEEAQAWAADAAAWVQARLGVAAPPPPPPKRGWGYSGRK